MKNKAIVQKMTRAAGRIGFQLKNHAPEILMIGGIGGAITSGIMACVATTKISEALEEPKTTIDAIHKAAEEGVIYVKNENDEVVETPYTAEDKSKDLAITYVKAGLSLAKLYAPAVILGGLSIASILASNNIMRKRNVALAAAYATVEKSFKQYRNNVIERFGEKVDQEMKYGVKATQFEETEINEKTGKEKTVKKTIDTVADDRLASPFARFFDVGNKYWEKNAEYNFMFLRSEQNWANDMLRSRGHLFLNDVLVRLGFDKTPEGQVFGWIYDPDNKEYDGDGYVDFGIYNMNRERVREFALGHERTILLDFNVDGDIYKLMKDPKYREKFLSA